MWREYTREKPAIRGIALASSALAFVGAMSLAAVLTRDRGTGLETRQDTPDWPLTFGIPPGFALTKPVETDLDADGDDPIGRATYRQGSGSHARTVTIEYFDLHDEKSAVEAFSVIAGESLEDAVAIEFGDQQEGIGTSVPRFGGHQFVGVTCWPNGIAVRVSLKSRTADSMDAAEFNRICLSVHLKDEATTRKTE